MNKKILFLILISYFALYCSSFIIFSGTSINLMIIIILIILFLIYFFINTRLYVIYNKFINSKEQLPKDKISNGMFYSSIIASFSALLLHIYTVTNFYQQINGRIPTDTQGNLGHLNRLLLFYVFIIMIVLTIVIDFVVFRQRKAGKIKNMRIIYSSFLYYTSLGLIIISITFIAYMGFFMIL